MRTIKVYCGESVQDKCGSQLHPLNEVERAVELLSSTGGDDIIYSNSPDFVMALQNIRETIDEKGGVLGVELEFFLDGVSYGSSIEEVFSDFNRSLDRISELT